ncbi:MAG: hypothetical protein QM684_18575, partial [Rhizobium sp.]
MENVSWFSSVTHYHRHYLVALRRETGDNAGFVAKFVRSTKASALTAAHFEGGLQSIDPARLYFYAAYLQRGS